MSPKKSTKSTPLNEVNDWSHSSPLITSSSLPTAAADMSADRNEKLLSEESYRLFTSDLDVPSDLGDTLGEMSNSAAIEPATEPSKADMTTKVLKTFTRPTSSGAPSITTGFQFSVAPKAQPKFTRPTKYKEANTPPKDPSIHEQDLGRGQTKGDSEQNAVVIHGDHLQEPAATSKAREENHPVQNTNTEKASATVEERDVKNDVSSQEILQKHCPRTENTFDFDVRPQRMSPTDSKPVTQKGCSISLLDKQDDNAPVDHNHGVQHPVTPNEDQQMSSIKPKDPHVALDAHRIQKSKDGFHTVISGKVTKPRMPKDPQRRVSLPAPLHNIEKTALSNEQILQLYLRNIHSEKDHTARRHRDMRNQIEQLVRVNSDYQKKLDEAEQELEERESHIEQQDVQVEQWKQQVSRFKKTLGETVKSHLDLRDAMNTLRMSSNELPKEVQNLQTELRECQAVTSSMSTKTASALRLAAQNHRTEMVSIETELTLAKKGFKDQAKQLRKEQAKCAGLEAFIAREIGALREREILGSQDLRPLVGKLSSLENQITAMDRKAPSLPTGLTVTVPGVDQCLELLKTVNEKENIDLSGLPSITTAVARIEEKLADSILQSGQFLQTVSAGTTQLETEIQTHGSALKDSLDALRLSLDDQDHLKTSVAELKVAAKGHVELVTALKHANDFAQQQACIPQDIVRKLSSQIEDFQQRITEITGKCDEQKAKDLKVQKETQGLRRDYEKEKGTSTALQEALESQTQKLTKKEEEVKELKVKRAEIEESLKHTQNSISKVRADNEEKDKEIAKKTDELAAAAKELQNIKAAETAQCEAVGELQTQLNGKEEMQSQLDSVMQEKIKADAKVANLEQHVANYEELQAECNRLADVERVNEEKEVELRKTFERNISLDNTNFKQGEELKKLREELKGAQKTLEATKSGLRVQPSQEIPEGSTQDDLTPATMAAFQELSSKPDAATRLSQEIPDSLSQDVLTPGIEAAFNQLIDTDMIDENAFQSLHSQKSQQRKDQGHTALPLRKGNQDTGELLLHPGLTSQVGASVELSASQRTTLIPETQHDPMDENDNDHHHSAFDRTSSLTPSSEVEELFGNIEEAIKAPRPDRGAATISTLRNVLSMRSSQSDEMLLETQTEQDSDIVKKRTIKTAANLQSKPTSLNDHSRSSRRSEATSGRSVVARMDSEPIQRPDKSQPPRFSPKRRRNEAPWESTERLSSDMMSPLNDHDKYVNGTGPNSSVKEKPRPNSTAKRQASSVDDTGSSPVRSGKRMKRNPSALESHHDKRSGSNKSQAAPPISSSKPMVRHSLPTGSRGSGLRTTGSTTSHPSQTKRTNKKSKSQAYDSRFGH